MNCQSSLYPRTNRKSFTTFSLLWAPVRNPWRSTDNCVGEAVALVTTSGEDLFAGFLAGVLRFSVSRKRADFGLKRRPVPAARNLPPERHHRKASKYRFGLEAASGIGQTASPCPMSAIGQKRTLAAPLGKRIQASPGFLLAQTTQVGELWRLSRPRYGLALLPVVYRLATHAGKPPEVGRR